MKLPMLARSADHLVVPHACDSLQGLGSLLLDFEKPALPTTPYYLPRGDREADVRYLAAELKALGKALAHKGEHEEAVDVLGQGIEVAERRGDVQAAKEMGVFRKRSQQALERA